MARDRDPPLQFSDKDDADGWLDGIVGDEDGADRSVYWRMAGWGVAAAAAVAIGIVANRSAIDPLAAETTTRYFESRAAQIETASRETQVEARRLAAAIETLNGDRDRIYARLSSVEQGFESVTGSIRNVEAAARAPSRSAEPLAAPATAPAQPATSPAEAAAPPPTIVSALSLPAQAETREKSAPAETIEPASDVWALGESSKTADTPVPATEFGIDLGASNSLDGLRRIWRTASSVHKAALGTLTPIVTVQDRGPRQAPLLRLVAGPLRNAADAARLCVMMMEKAKDCKTAVFDGQKLQVSAEVQDKPSAKRPQSRVPKQSQRSAVSGPESMSAAPPQVSLLPLFANGQ